MKMERERGSEEGGEQVLFFPHQGSMLTFSPSACAAVGDVLQLHAHLTGSITRRCLHDIWRDKKVAGQAEGLEDPLVVMPEGQNDHDLTR